MNKTNKKYDLEDRTTIFAENVISLCKKEAKETKYWLRLLLKTNETKSDNYESLAKEAQELVLIFSKIAISTS